MEYIVGIDSGGTNTRISIYTTTLEFVKNEYLGPGNIHDLKKDNYKNLLNQISESIKKYNVKYITYGCPGYGENIADTNFIDKEFAKHFEEIPYTIVNDIDIACMGSLNFEDGVNIISGTGSIAQIVYNNKKARIGGWGYLLGDEGSAFHIGSATLKEFAKQCDGRKPKTILYKLVKDYYQLDNEFDLITIIYSAHNPREIISKVAVIADDAANNGCDECYEILENSAIELALHIKALLVNVEETLTVSYSGSVFNSKIILNKFIKELEIENCSIREPLHEPLYGAVLNSYREITK